MTASVSNQSTPQVVPSSVSASNPALESKMSSMELQISKLSQMMQTMAEMQFGRAAGNVPANYVYAQPQFIPQPAQMYYQQAAAAAAAAAQPTAQDFGFPPDELETAPATRLTNNMTTPEKKNPASTSAPNTSTPNEKPSAKAPAIPTQFPSFDILKEPGHRTTGYHPVGTTTDSSWTGNNQFYDDDENSDEIVLPVDYFADGHIGAENEYAIPAQTNRDRLTMENVDVQFFPNMKLDEPKDSEKEVFSAKAKVFKNGNKTLLCVNDLKIFAPKLSGTPRLLIADPKTGKLALDQKIPAESMGSAAKLVLDESDSVQWRAKDTVQGQSAFTAKFKKSGDAVKFVKLFNDFFKADKKDSSATKSIVFKAPTKSKPGPAKEKDTSFVVKGSKKDPTKKLNSLFSGVTSKSSSTGFKFNSSPDKEAKNDNPGLNFKFSTPFSSSQEKSDAESKPSTSSLFKSDDKKSDAFSFSSKKDGKSIFDTSSSKSTLFSKKADDNPTASASGDANASAIAIAEAEPTDITFKPLVKLDFVENHDNGQAGDSIIFEEASRIYHFALDRNMWVDHGKVTMQISANKQTNKAKTIGRDDTTGKLRMCGLTDTSADIQAMKSKGCSWNMKDFSGQWSEEGKDIVVSAKFKSTEIRDKFMNLYKRSAMAGDSKQPTEPAEPAPVPPASEKKKAPENPKAAADGNEEDVSWLGDVSKKGETLWETLADVNEFSTDQKWSEGIICRIKVCTMKVQSLGVEKFWVEIWDEQIQDQLHIFTFQKDHLIKVQKNAAVWSCVNFAEDPGKITTLCATFKSEAEAKHCQAIFESLRGQGDKSAIKKVILDSKSGDDKVAPPLEKVEEDPVPKVEPFKVGAPKKPLFGEESGLFSNVKTEEKADDKPKSKLFGDDKGPIFGDSTSKSIFGDKPLKFDLKKGETKSKPLFSFSKDESSKPSGFSGFASSGGFADASSSGFGSIFADKGDSTTFSFASKGESKPAVNPFASAPANADEGGNNEDDFNGLDYTLKPIVSLQETAVDSGDQSDEIVFEEISKVYRLSKDPQEWKERGHGDLRITKNVEHNKFRIIQRDQVTQKLRVHQIISEGMEVGPFEGKPELFSFCAKFKTPEIAARFEEAVTNAIAQTA